MATARAEDDTKREHHLQVQRALGPKLCENMQGKWVGLPGQGASSAYSTGRWLLNECQSVLHQSGTEEFIRLEFGGPGYQWVQAEASGCSVKQSLFFEAYVKMDAQVGFEYDETQHEIRVALKPLVGNGHLEIRAQSRGEVSPEGWLGLCTLGRDQVREKVKNTLETELATQLSQGFIAHISLNTLESNLEVANAGFQEKPFAHEPARIDLLNESMIVARDQPMFIGPFVQRLPLRLEHKGGNGYAVGVLCEQDAQRYFTSRMQGQRAPLPQHRTLHHQTTALQHVVEIPQVVCAAPQDRVVIMLQETESDESRLPLALRVSVDAEVYLANMIVQGQESQETTQPQIGGAAPAQPLFSSYRLVIERVVVFERKPDGSSWDAMGGAADPFLVVRPRSMTGATAELRLTLPSDRQVSEPSHSFVERFAPINFPIELELMDIDLTVNDFIGRGVIQSPGASNAMNFIELQQQGRTTARVYYRLYGQ